MVVLILLTIYLYRKHKKEKEEAAALETQVNGMGSAARVGKVKKRADVGDSTSITSSDSTYEPPPTIESEEIFADTMAALTVKKKKTKKNHAVEEEEYKEIERQYGDESSELLAPPFVDPASLDVKPYDQSKTGERDDVASSLLGFLNLHHAFDPSSSTKDQEEVQSQINEHRVSVEGSAGEEARPEGHHDPGLFGMFNIFSGNEEAKEKEEEAKEKEEEAEDEEDDDSESSPVPNDFESGEEKKEDEMLLLMQKQEQRGPSNGPSGHHKVETALSSKTKVQEGQKQKTSSDEKQEEDQKHKASFDEKQRQEAQPSIIPVMGWLGLGSQQDQAPEKTAPTENESETTTSTPATATADGSQPGLKQQTSDQKEQGQHVLPPVMGWLGLGSQQQDQAPPKTAPTQDEIKTTSTPTTTTANASQPGQQQQTSDEKQQQGQLGFPPVMGWLGLGSAETGQAQDEIKETSSSSATASATSNTAQPIEKHNDQQGFPPVMGWLGLGSTEQDQAPAQTQDELKKTSSSSSETTSASQAVQEEQNWLGAVPILNMF